ncbi:hypothetical protein [Musicola paradisiaca]|uniref:hypothetical protein n=1 Tax=Musicola paradisiaca TaxID=69223 RepID=UPI0003C7DDB7|nr:hypothetical protein [Musicola paradisiaca]
MLFSFCHIQFCCFTSFISFINSNFTAFNLPFTVMMTHAAALKLKAQSLTAAAEHEAGRDTRKVGDAIKPRSKIGPDGINAETSPNHQNDSPKESDPE